MIKSITLFIFSYCLVSCNQTERSKTGKTNETANEWKLSWSDEFNYTGLPDSTKWNYEVGGHGWGNNELQYYTANDTSTAIARDGYLFITALPRADKKNPYKSARLVTKGKLHFKYGKIEVSAKLPVPGLGTWPAIWMLGENIGKADWPMCGEIDIMEHVGYMPDSVFASVHTETYNHVKGTQKTKGFYLPDLDARFHQYSVEWDSTKIVFMVDNKIYLQFENEHKTEKEWPFSQPFFLLMNVAAGGNWGAAKGFDPKSFPATMQVDYVRVFTK